MLKNIWEYIEPIKFHLIYVLIVLIITIPLSLKNCSTGNKPEDYKIICIEGHEYYKANFMAKIALSIKLDPDGKPIACKDEK